MTMIRGMALAGVLSLVLVSEALGQQGTEQEPADTGGLLRESNGELYMRIGIIF